MEEGTMKTKKAMKEYIVKVPVKYLPGDKVWVLDYIDDPNDVVCDACGHSSCRCIYVVHQDIIKTPLMETDCDTNRIYCDRYKTKHHDTLYTQYLFDTEKAAQKAANKLNKEYSG
jgi:hypothetical protein